MDKNLNISNLNTRTPNREMLRDRGQSAKPFGARDQMAMNRFFESTNVSGFQTAHNDENNLFNTATESSPIKPDELNSIKVHKNKKYQQVMKSEDKNNGLLMRE